MDLNKEQLWAMTRDLKRIPVELDNGTVYVRELSGEMRDCMERAWLDYQKESGQDDDDYSGWFCLEVAYGVVDANGNRLFTDADIDAIGRLPTRIVSRLARAFEKLNGMGRYGEVDLPKSLGAQESADCGSTSP